MRGPEQGRARIVQLIDEAESIDSLDLTAFEQWVQASYEALEFDPWQQQRFDEYCRSSSDSTSMTHLIQCIDKSYFVSRC